MMMSMYNENSDEDDDKSDTDSDKVDSHFDGDIE